MRCGTSEVILSGEEQHVSLPTYDFPASIGCVASGVNLIVKQTEEEFRDRNTFSVVDARIYVSCVQEICD